MTDPDRAIVEAAIARLQGWADANRVREQASQQHALQDPRKGYFVLIRGLRTSSDTMAEVAEGTPLSATFPDLQEASTMGISLTRIRNFPALADLAAALHRNSQHLYSTLAGLYVVDMHEL